MGRRNVNTTKSGKYMNPTDQARKEARKRELKKNKKQRMAVRQAVLKSKDPVQLLEEAAYYDKQEYDASTVAAAASNAARLGSDAQKLSERVIQEKRKKLLETFDRVVAMYRREDPEKATTLIKAKQEYESKRQELILYYEQVKLAERVTADDIPLPPPSEMDFSAPTMTAQIPLPSEMPPPQMHADSAQPAKSILKRTAAAAPASSPATAALVKKKPPGPPPGPPPELSDSEDEDEGAPPAPGVDKTSNKRIRFADESTKAAVTGLRPVEADKPFPVHPVLPMAAAPAFPGSLPAPGLAPPLPRPAAIPPPLRHRPPMPPAPGLVPPRLSAIPLPPARLPPPAFQQLAGPQPGVYAAPPSLHKTSVPLAAPAMLDDGMQHSQPGPGGATIEAKPQLKNLIGDATRFVPTAVKVRRTVRDGRGRLVVHGGGQGRADGSSAPGSGLYEQADQNSATGGAIGDKTNKEDAYDQFMREMEAIL